MTQPKISVPKNSLDLLLEISGALIVLLSFAFVFMHYGDLPEQVPVHFGADGKPDGFGEKNQILIIPGIGLITYIVVWWIGQSPHTFNYLSEITEENAFEKYRFAGKVIRYLNVYLVILFGWLTWTSVMTALGRQPGLGPAFVFFFIGGGLAIIVYSIAGSSGKN